MKTKKVVLFSGSLLILIFLAFLLFSGSSDHSSDSHTHSGDSSLEHVHGIVSAGNYEVYIATHNGLFKFEDDSHLDQVGESTDDYMSFAINPDNSLEMYASGHSNDEHENKEDYANLNVLKSVDGGINWEEISKAINGPVDFHAMGISVANPNVLYGWFSGLQRSLDGGYSWELIDTQGLYEVLVFETHPTNENIVYAATANGLMISNDQGSTWDFLTNELERTPIISLSINQKNPSLMLSNSKRLGLAKSTDGGITWRKIDEGFSGELVTYITFDKNDENVVYAITKENSMYKSNNQGEDWEKLISFLE